MCPGGEEFAKAPQTAHAPLSDEGHMPSHIMFEGREITTDSWLMRCVNDLPSLQILGFISSIFRVTTSDS